MPDGSPPSSTVEFNGAVAAMPTPPADSRASILYADEHVTLTPRDAWRLLVKSWPFIAVHRRLVAYKTALAVFSLGFFLMTPWPVKIVIDNVIDGRPLTGIPHALIAPLAGTDRVSILVVVTIFLLAAVVLVGMVAGDSTGLGTDTRSGGLDQAGTTANDANDGWSLWNGLFGYWEARVTIELTQQLNQSVRTAVYGRFLRSPLGLFADQKIGDAIFRVMNDSASIGAVLYRGVLAPLMSLVMFVIALLVLWAQFSNERIIPLLAVISLPVIAIGSGLFGRMLREQSQRMRESGSNVMAAFEERVAQVQLIKAFGQEERETLAVNAASWGSYRSTLRMVGILMAILIVLVPLVFAIVAYGLYYLMLAVIENRLTLGDVVLLISYLSMLMNPMSTLGGTWASMQAPAAGLRRMHSVLDGLSEPFGDGSTGGIDRRIDRVEFRDVAIGYGGVDVLRGVSMSLRAGEMIALAGPSGAGKTTLIYSIPRFTEPSAGVISFDGVDSRRVAPAALRQRVGFVFQQESLFSTTIEANIRYGNPGASEADVREAAAMAGAAEFIERLPEGYRTMLGRRGARLSVGQKQRIAIARALLCRPEIMVLDEPTAPLDPASEGDLIQTLRALARDRIVLIVAHRPDTLAACDRVFFVHDGAVSPPATHRELLATDAAYRAYLAHTESEIHG